MVEVLFTNAEFRKNDSEGKQRLTATRLCDFAEKILGRSVIHFTCRREASTFLDQPIRLVGRRTAPMRVRGQGHCDVGDYRLFLAL